MATLAEIKQALKIFTDNGVKAEDITILHCNTEYPTPYEDVNLNVLAGLKKIFQEYNIGFSDHSPGYFAGIAAVPYGITFIEKHFTLNKDFEGPDHKASITPDELRLLCNGIRAIERALGSFDKRVTNSERKNKLVARKSIVAKRDIKKGEIFTTDNITTKRPGNGISPMYWYEVLGKKAEQDFLEDQLIKVSGFEEQEI
ncbi:N,N'-diacetyllegionaminic acid synthase [Escherichia coli]|nr:N,N'-diacetyllegionaminic acid synthase [Escherichia coli]